MGLKDLKIVSMTFLLQFDGTQLMSKSVVKKISENVFEKFICNNRTLVTSNKCEFFHSAMPFCSRV